MSVDNRVNQLQEFIESGILECYALGVTSAEENIAVEQMIASFEVVRNEMNEINAALESYTSQLLLSPSPTIKPFLMAVIDYTERIKNGELPSFPPVLNPASSIKDYNEWLSRKDMVLPSNFKDVHAKIIGHSPTGTTAIVWLKDGSPEEVHNHELESFLIVEGSCDITIDGKIHQLVPGDYLTIPLYKTHHVRITSTIPCKLILERRAA